MRARKVMHGRIVTKWMFTSEQPLMQVIRTRSQLLIDCANRYIFHRRINLFTVG